MNCAVVRKPRASDPCGLPSHRARFDFFVRPTRQRSRQIGCGRSRAMGKRKLLKSQDRLKLIDVPADEDSLIRHYSLSSADRLEVGLPRREHIQLGFAIQLCLMRYPGRVLTADETPPRAMLKYVAEQIGVDPGTFALYARREETRRYHTACLMVYLGMAEESSTCFRRASSALVRFNHHQKCVRANFARRNTCRCFLRLLDCENSRPINLMNIDTASSVSFWPNLMTFRSRLSGRDLQRVPAIIVGGLQGIDRIEEHAQLLGVSRLQSMCATLRVRCLRLSRGRCCRVPQKDAVATRRCAGVFEGQHSQADPIQPAPMSGPSWHFPTARE